MPSAASRGLVSVVIPNFNHGGFLGEAIESALSQGVDPVEVIVVDDGSTDDSGAVAAHFGDRVRYLWQQNKGLPGARNTGIRVARGEFVAFLDADDSWLPGFLEAALERFAGREELGAVHTGFYCIDAQGARLPQVNVSTVPEDRMYDRLLDGEFFVPSSVVARRECFDRVGLFDEVLRGSEDWDMWLRVSREYRFAGIDRPLVNYRIHGSNMSGNPDYMLRYQLVVVAKHFGDPEAPPTAWPTEKQRAYGAVYRYAAHGYYLRHDLDNSRRYLRLALETNPGLCESVDMYYELACADQPLGRRTAEAPVDIEGNARFLLSALDEIFSDPVRPAQLAGRRSTAVGRALTALGLLGYASGRHDLARRYLAKALVTDPSLAAAGRVWKTLAKSLVVPRVLQAARRRAGHGGGARHTA